MSVRKKRLAAGLLAAVVCTAQVLGSSVTAYAGDGLSMAGEGIITTAESDAGDLAAEGFEIYGEKLVSYHGDAKEVVIPQGITSVKAGAFDGSSVVSITIPKGVSIDCYQGMQVPSGIPFRYCSSLEEIIVDEENEDYASEDGILYYKSKTALIRCPQGKSGTVRIIDGASIGRGAFSGCSKLTGITFSGCTHIGANAFEGCSSLTELVITEGVEEIAGGAFSGCSSLTSITIPKSVNSISTVDGFVGPMDSYCSPFADCDSLREIKVDAGNPAYVFENNVLYNKQDKTEMVLCIMGKSTKAVIPGNVTHIGDGALSGWRNLADVTIPSGVKTIGKGVFYSCNSLTEMVIPSGVTSIGEGIFSYCRNLASLTIPESVTEIGDLGYYAGNELTIYGKAGSYAETYAKEYSIKFSSISSAQPVIEKTLSDKDVSLSTVSYYYDGNAKQPGVIVKDGNVILKEGTDYTVSYEDNVNAGTAKVVVAGKGNYKGTVTKTFTIVVQKGTSHRVGSFQYNVTGVSTAEVVGWQDKKATKVKIPPTVTIGGTDFKVTAIRKNAFKNSKKIVSAEIGDNVTSVGASAFEGCTKLSKVTVGKGVTEIGSSVFKKCKKLSKITIKSLRLKKVGKNALKGIKATAKIKVPAKKLKAYRKLLKNKGQGKKVKIVK